MGRPWEGRLLGRPQLSVDAIEKSVDEPAGLPGAELLGDLEGLVDRDLGRNLHHPHQLEHALAEDIAIHHRHAVEIPVLGELRDDLVDLLLMLLGAPHQRLDEAAHLAVHRVPGPELVQVGLGAGRVLQVELVEQLGRQLARLPALAHQRVRAVPRRAWSQPAISSTARAASAPRLPTEPPARSQACSSVLAVITPKPMGTPVASPAWRMPAAVSRETYSKCGVSPRMTTPTQAMPA